MALKCPRCATLVARPAEGSPVCPTCGYGSKDAAPAPSAAPVEEPTAAPVSDPPDPPTAPTSAPPVPVPGPAVEAESDPHAAPAEPAAPAQADEGPFSEQDSSYQELDATPGDLDPTQPPAAAAPGTGKTRNPAIVVLLSLVTLGIYNLVWQYKVFKEIDVTTGQVHKSGLFVTALIFMFIPFLNIVAPILFLVYLLSEVGQMRQAKRVAGLPGGLGPGGFIGIVLVTWILSAAILFAMAGTALITAMGSTDPDAIAGLLGGTFLLAMLLATLILYVPTILVQTQANKFWDGIHGTAPAGASYGTAV